METQFNQRILVATARDYAMRCHANTNHLYDGNPYFLHIRMVVNVAERFIRSVGIPENIHECIIAACYCHDLIEDCRQTYSDVKNATSKEVADIVYAVTNEKGKNRQDRASDKYYDDMINVPGAVFVKLCDRIANIKYSAMMESEMFDMYRKEHYMFEKKLFSEDYVKIWQHMRILLLNVS